MSQDRQAAKLKRSRNADLLLDIHLIIQTEMTGHPMENEHQT